jgi:TonB family protein
MRRVLVWQLFVLATVVLLHLAFVEGVTAQPPPAETSQPAVVLTKLFPPVYPPLARQAAVSGEVVVQLSIRQDGSVESANVVSGHAMLKQAALESAQKSIFECRECSQAITTYSLVFAFELRRDGDCHNALSRMPEVTQSQGRVTITAPQPCLYLDPDYMFKRVRSAKCLYLWKCGLGH